MNSNETFKTETLITNEIHKLGYSLWTELSHLVPKPTQSKVHALAISE